MIYLDLDGVFADYRGSFARILGRDYHEDPASAWAILDQEPCLFKKLSLLPGAKDLLTSIERVAGPNEGVHFLTALPEITGELFTAALDKAWWIRNALCSSHPVICVNGWRRKKEYAREGSILVDDSARNIEDWIGAGGIGILHVNAVDTIAQLDAALVARY